jgi:hypothetical protein
MLVLLGITVGYLGAAELLKHFLYHSQAPRT